MQTEVLIIRSTLSQRLFDVVRIDYNKEDVEVLEKGLSFEDAVGAAEMHKEEVAA